MLALGPTISQAQAPQGNTSSISPVERVYWLAKLWEEVDYNFAYFDQVPELDWSAHFRAYIPQVLEAPTDFEYYRLLQRFLARLGDGHTLIIYPWEMRQQRPIDLPWVELREVDRRAIVENVETALADRLPVGSEVIRVDGQSVAERLEQEVFPYMSVSTEHVKWRDGIRGSTGHMYGLLAGPAGSTTRVEFVTPDGGTGELLLARDRGARKASWAVAPRPKPLLEYRELGGGIAYVALNSFNDPALVQQFDSVMPALLEARGIVIDLRRNGGGKDNVAKEILSRLSSQPMLGPAWSTRSHVATYRAWGLFADEEEWAKKYRPYLEGRVWHDVPPDTLVPGPGAKITARIAVLIGQETESSAENFLIYLDRRPGVTLVGQPTVGSSGQPLFIDLPLGGRAWIVTKRNTYPDGRTYIGTGVIPDEYVRVTVDDVRLGRDPALQTAIQVLH